jgi:tetratricopeptide (TPR) repeat protein
MLTGSTWPPQDLTETIPDIMKQPAAPAGALRAIGRVDGWLEGALLAPLFLAGCLLALALWKKDALFLAAGAGYLLAVYSFLSPLGPRYRIVAEPLMGLLAAGAACFVWSRFVRSRERTEEVPPAPGWLSGSRPLIALAAAACCWCWFMTDLALAYKARSLSFSPEAAPLLRAAAGTPPDKAALAGLGYLALDRAMYPAALKYFERALALDSGSKAAGDGRAAALFRMGRGGEALAELKRGEALHGPSPDLAYNIALVQYLSGNAPEALKHLSLFLAHPDIPLPMRDRALALKEELLGRT